MNGLITVQVEHTSSNHRRMIKQVRDMLHYCQYLRSKVNLCLNFRLSFRIHQFLIKKHQLELDCSTMWLFLNGKLIFLAFHSQTKVKK
jgi:hypothetical protein